MVQQAPFLGFSRGSGGGSMSGGGLAYSPSTKIRSTRSQTSCCSPRFHEYVVSWFPYWFPLNMRTGTVSAATTRRSPGEGDGIRVVF